MAEQENGAQNVELKKDERKYNPFEAQQQRKHLVQFYRKGGLIPQEIGQPESMTIEHHVRLLTYYGFKNIQKHWAFFQADFPKGWKLSLPPIAPHWCYLLDEQGRKRAAIIYKFAGRGKREFVPDMKRVVKTDQIVTLINYMPRFRVMVKHLVEYKQGKKNNSEHYRSPIVAQILDAETKVLYETEAIQVDCEIPIDGTIPKEFFSKDAEIRNVLYDKAKAVLDLMYPENENILNYWDLVPNEVALTKYGLYKCVLYQRATDKSFEEVPLRKIAEGFIDSDEQVINITFKTEHWHYGEEDEFNLELLRLRQIQVEVVITRATLTLEQIREILPMPNSEGDEVSAVIDETKQDENSLVRGKVLSSELSEAFGEKSKNKVGDDILEHVVISTEIRLKGLKEAPTVMVYAMDDIKDDLVNTKVYFMYKDKEYFCHLSDLHKDIDGWYTLVEYQKTNI